MAYVIAEPCIGTKDTACVDVCPVDCIHRGACVPVCPVTAIFVLEDLPEKWASFTPVNADYFKKKGA